MISNFVVYFFQKHIVQYRSRTPKMPIRNKNFPHTYSTYSTCVLCCNYCDFHEQPPPCVAKKIPSVRLSLLKDCFLFFSAKEGSCGGRGERERGMSREAPAVDYAMPLSLSPSGNALSLSLLPPKSVGGGGNPPSSSGLALCGALYLLH